MRSTPTPVRQTTFVRLSCEIISRVNGTEPCMMIPSASRPASATSASLRGLAMIISASMSSRIGSMSWTGTSLLPKYLTRNFAIVLSSQSEQAHGVVPENFLARLARQMIVAAHVADGAVGKFVDRVAVRIVRRDHESLVSHVLDVHRRELLARLAARPALALEIIARLLLGRARGAVRLVLPVLVHSFQPEWHPAAPRLQMRDLELGKFLQHAVAAEVQAREHLLDRMAGDVPAELAVAVRARLRQDRARAFVHADRDAEIGG